jgi:RNA polymerase sigma-70 factor (ECF subfamily)
MTTYLYYFAGDPPMADPHGYRVASRIKKRGSPTGGSILKVGFSHRLGEAAEMEATADKIATRSHAQVQAQAQMASELALLVARMRLGDERALETLYDATVGKLFALASAILRNVEDAEEVVCSTYSYAWANAARFDAERANALGWLLMLCRSRSLDLIRKRRMLGTAIDLNAVPETEASDAAQPDDLLDLLQQRSRVRTALAKLSPERRRLISLAFLQGLSHQEIAASCGLALGTVKSHVRRALAQLREELEIE